MTKKHWYAFTFMYSNAVRMCYVYTSVYIGYNDRNVTLPRIKAAKLAQGIPESAVLMSVSYLGYMSEDEFSPEEQSGSGDDGTTCT